MEGEAFFKKGHSKVNSVLTQNEHPMVSNFSMISEQNLLTTNSLELQRSHVYNCCHANLKLYVLISPRK